MGTDYVTYFFSIPGMTVNSFVSLFALTLFRIAPLAVFPPFFGGKLIPVTARMGLVIVLTVMLLPIVVHTSTLNVPIDGMFAILALKELAIGFFLSFLVSLPFFIIQSSGVIIDFMRGASMMQQQDPSLQNQSSPIGVIYNLILIVLFYQIDGPFLFFDAFIKSYSVVPIEGFINPVVFSLNHPITKKVFDLLNILLATAIQLAAPAMVAILMTEMFLGIANRLAPQVQISFLGMSLKSFVGIGLMWISLFFVLQQTSVFSLDWIKTISKLLDTIPKAVSSL